MELLGLQELLLIVFCLAVFVPYILFLVALQKAAKVISVENRKIEPGLVWILLVPLVNAIMFFIVVNGLATGFKREYEKYAIFKQGKPTYGPGFSMAILLCIYYLVNVLTSVYLLTGLLAWAILIIWIVYWVQVNKTKNELERLKTTFNLEQGEQSIFI